MPKSAGASAAAAHTGPAAIAAKAATAHEDNRRARARRVAATSCMRSILLVRAIRPGPVAGAVATAIRFRVAHGTEPAATERRSDASRVLHFRRADKGLAGKMPARPRKPIARHPVLTAVPRRA